MNQSLTCWLFKGALSNFHQLRDFLVLSPHLALLWLEGIITLSNCSSSWLSWRAIVSLFACFAFTYRDFVFSPVFTGSWRLENITRSADVGWDTLCMVLRSNRSLFPFWVQVSCIPGWHQTHYMAKGYLHLGSSCLPFPSPVMANMRH